MRSRSSKPLDISSDFDNTIIRENAAVVLIRHYLVHGGDPLFSRLRRFVPLMTRGLRRAHMNVLYEVLGRIPAAERKALLAKLQPSKAWLAATNRLKAEHGREAVQLTIISRNCADVIRDWVLTHKKALAAHGITVHAIIANKPVLDRKQEFVCEYEGAHGDFPSARHAGAGRLHLKGKRKFIRHHKVYICDSYEGELRGLVKEFVQV